MPGEVQRLPWGLLGFFDIKTMGRYPNVLSDQLVVVLDELWNLNDANYGLVIVSSNPSAAVGFDTTPALTVPQQELWRVSALSIVVTTGVGESIVFSPSVRQPNDPAAIIAFGGPVSQAASLVRNYSISTMPGIPRWLPPGASIGNDTQEVVGGSVDVSYRLRYLRFPL